MAKLKPSLAGAMVCVLLGTLPVYGEEYSRSKELKAANQLREIRNQKAQAERAKRETEKEIGQIMHNIDVVKEQIDSLDHKIDSQEAQLKKVSGELTKTETDLQKVTDDLADQVEVFNGRVRDIYENGNVSYLEVLLGAQDFSDFLNRFEYMQAIVELDGKIVDDIEAKQKQIETLKLSLEQKKKQIASLKASTEKQFAEQERKKEVHADLLQEAKSEKVKYEEMIDDLEQEESQKAAELIRIQQAKRKNKVVQSSGAYAWPTPSSSRVTSAYGNRFHPILKRNKFHTGIDIGASSGSSIVATQGGEVIFAGWMNGYGNTVIIDHGGGLSSLYAHQSRILVSVGKTVEKGEEIGKVGSTGRSTGPHLHFEIRKDGDPVNPRNYV